MNEPEHTTPAEAVSEQVGKNFEAGAEPKYAPPPADLPESSPVDGPSATVEPVDQQLQKAAELPESQKVVYSDPQVSQSSEQVRQPVLNADYDPLPEPQKATPAKIDQPQPASVAPSANTTPIELSRSTASEIPEQQAPTYAAPNAVSPDLQGGVVGEVSKSPEQPVSNTEQFDPAPIVGAIADLISEVKGLREDMGKQKTDEQREQPADKPTLVVEQKATVQKPADIPEQKQVGRPVAQPMPQPKQEQKTVTVPSPVKVPVQPAPVQPPMPMQQPRQERPAPQQQQQQPSQNTDGPEKAQKTAEQLQKLLAANQQQMSQVLSVLEQISGVIEQAMRQSKQNEEAISRLVEFTQGTRNRAMGSGWRR